MYYCLICRQKYNSINAYSNHLNRVKHRRNLMKLRTLFKCELPKNETVIKPPENNNDD